jgi:hypothetical protein
VLYKNIHKNKLENVIPLQYGLSNKETRIKINLYSSSGNNSIFKRQLPAGHSLKFKGEEIINVTSLDNLFTKMYPHISLSLLWNLVKILPGMPGIPVKIWNRN